MGLLSIFKKDEVQTNLTAENRALGLEKRRQNRMIKDLEHEKEKIFIKTEIEKAKIDYEKSQIDLEIARMDLEDTKAERNGEIDDEPVFNSQNMQNPEMLMMTMLMQILNKHPNNAGVSNPLSVQPEPTNSVVSPPPPAIIKPQPTDEELLKMKDELPNIYLEQAKTASDDELKRIICSNFPEWNEETTKKALVILRK